MTVKKPTKESAKNAKKETSEDKLVMLTIPEVNLRLVYEWIESEKMTMPHNQVMSCLKLLGTATVVKD